MWCCDLGRGVLCSLCHSDLQGSAFPVPQGPEGGPCPYLCCDLWGSPFPMRGHSPHAALIFRAHCPSWHRDPGGGSLLPPHSDLQGSPFPTAQRPGEAGRAPLPPLLRHAGRSAPHRHSDRPSPLAGRSRSFRLKLPALLALSGSKQSLPPEPPDAVIVDVSERGAEPSSSSLDNGCLGCARPEDQRALMEPEDGDAPPEPPFTHSSPLAERLRPAPFSDGSLARSRSRESCHSVRRASSVDDIEAMRGDGEKRCHSRHASAGTGMHRGASTGTGRGGGGRGQRRAGAPWWWVPQAAPSASQLGVPRHPDPRLGAPQLEEPRHPGPKPDAPHLDASHPDELCHPGPHLDVPCHPPPRCPHLDASRHPSPRLDTPHLASHSCVPHTCLPHTWISRVIRPHTTMPRSWLPVPACPTSPCLQPCTAPHLAVHSCLPYASLPHTWLPLITLPHILMPHI